MLLKLAAIAGFVWLAAHVVTLDLVVRLGGIVGVIGLLVLLVRSPQWRRVAWVLTCGVGGLLLVATGAVALAIPALLSAAVVGWLAFGGLGGTSTKIALLDDLDSRA
jgi:hypothetical protein